MRNLLPNCLGLATTVLLIFFGLQSNASKRLDSKCKFIDRAAVELLLAAEPSVVIGAVDCSGDHPDAHSLKVLHFSSASEIEIESSVIQIAEITHSMSQSAAVTWKSNQSIDKLQFIVTTRVAKTDHSNAQVMRHYAFVVKASDGSSFVFVHSATDQTTQAIRPTLEVLNDELRFPTFLSQIHI